jgi:hypothetical protein
MIYKINMIENQKYNYKILEILLILSNYSFANLKKEKIKDFMKKGIYQNRAQKCASQ